MFRTTTQKDRQLTRKEMDWGQLSWGKCEDEKRRTLKRRRRRLLLFPFSFHSLFLQLTVYSSNMCMCIVYIYIYMHVLLLLLIFCMLECFLSLLNKKRGWVHGHLHHEAKKWHGDSMMASWDEKWMFLQNNYYPHYQLLLLFFLWCMHKKIILFSFCETEKRKESMKLYSLWKCSM